MTQQAIWLQHRLRLTNNSQQKNHGTTRKMRREINKINFSQKKYLPNVFCVLYFRYLSLSGKVTEVLTKDFFVGRTLAGLTLRNTSRITLSVFHFIIKKINLSCSHFKSNHNPFLWNVHPVLLNRMTVSEAMENYEKENKDETALSLFRSGRLVFLTSCAILSTGCTSVTKR